MKTTQIQLKSAPSLGSETHLEKALRAIPEVNDVKIQAEAKRVTIEHDNVAEEKLLQAIRGTGISAELIPETAEVLSPSLPKIGGGEEK